MEKLRVTKSNHKKRRIVKDRLHICLQRLIAKEECDAYEKRLMIALESNKENLKPRAKEEKREKETRELEQHAEQKKFWPEEEEQIPKEEQQEGEKEEIKIGKEFKTELNQFTKILEDTKKTCEKQLCYDNKYVVKSRQVCRPLQEKGYSFKRIKHRRMSVDGRSDQNDNEDSSWRNTTFSP